MADRARILPLTRWVRVGDVEAATGLSRRAAYEHLARAAGRQAGDRGAIRNDERPRVSPRALTSAVAELKDFKPTRSAGFWRVYGYRERASSIGRYGSVHRNGSCPSWSCASRRCRASRVVPRSTPPTMRGPKSRTAALRVV